MVQASACEVFFSFLLDAGTASVGDPGLAGMSNPARRLMFRVRHILDTGPRGRLRGRSERHNGRVRVSRSGSLWVGTSRE